MIKIRSGRRAVVLGVAERAEAAHAMTALGPAHGTGLHAQTAPGAFPAVERIIVDLHVRHLGTDFARFSAEADLTTGADLRKLLVAAVRRRGGDPAQIDEYEMDVRLPTDKVALMTFATSPI